MEAKIKEIREEDGVVYQRVRYYEGDVTTEPDLTFDINEPVGHTAPVTRYRRQTLIEEVVYEYEAI